jgi:NAD+-processing family protein with receiver domain
MALAKVTVPKGSVVFILEDDPNRIHWFERAFKGQVGTIEAMNPEDALYLLKDLNIETIDLFFFDHDLGGPFKPPFSIDVAKYLAETDPYIGNRVIIHSLNPGGAENLKEVMSGAKVLPFGTFEIEIE